MTPRKIQAAEHDTGTTALNSLKRIADALYRILDRTATAGEDWGP